MTRLPMPVPGEPPNAVVLPEGGADGWPPVPGCALAAGEAPGGGEACGVPLPGTSTVIRTSDGATAAYTCEESAGAGVTDASALAMLRLTSFWSSWCGFGWLQLYAAAKTRVATTVAANGSVRIAALRTRRPNAVASRHAARTRA